MTRHFAAHDFLAEPTEIRDWQLQGLPGDDFSVENGVLVNRGSRWPLMIDPQNQVALKPAMLSSSTDSSFLVSPLKGPTTAKGEQSVR